MTLALRNIKVHIGLSEETHAYTAVVYLDGKKAVEVSNEGRGGCDRQRSANGHNVEEINDWCVAALPKWRGFDGEMNDTDLEVWCHEQVDRHLLLKELKRIMRSKAVFIEDGKVWEIGIAGAGKYESKMGGELRRQYPTAVILNDLPPRDAVVLYEKAVCGCEGVTV